MLWALASACLLAGCVGADATRAQALLQQAQVAQQAVRSEGFVVRLTFEADGHSAGLGMQGAAQLKGAGAGDFYLKAIPLGELATASAAQLNFTVVRRRGTVAFRTAAGTRTMSLPQAQTQLGAGVGNPTSFIDAARYVKSVSVDSTDLAGQPVDRIVGKLDTGKLMSSVGVGANGFAKQLLDGAGVHVGDIRAVLFVARDTHLLKVMFADMDIHAGGKTGHMHLSIALNDVNQPVAFPTL